MSLCCLNVFINFKLMIVLGISFLGFMVLNQMYILQYRDKKWWKNDQKFNLDLFKEMDKLLHP